jgi:hypothetical protein
MTTGLCHRYNKIVLCVFVTDRWADSFQFRGLRPQQWATRCPLTITARCQTAGGSQLRVRVRELVSQFSFLPHMVFVDQIQMLLAPISPHMVIGDDAYFSRLVANVWAMAPQLVCKPGSAYRSLDSRF